jgi:NAD(P)-dependent dehydrogenase (short-subunit alcohol dehydrogenase family)
MTRAQRFLVTGAGSGIGLAITQALVGGGHHVYAGARRDDDLAQLAAMPQVTPLRLDVSDAAQVAAAAARVAADGGLLHGLVHNAGIGELGHLVAWQDADLLRLFEANVFGPVRLTRELVQPLLRAHGRVVCIGSQGGSITRPLYGPYTMTKYALEAFAACLRQEMAPHGVAVSIVQPGAVSTRIGDTAGAANDARLRATPAPFDVEAQAVLAAWHTPAAASEGAAESAQQRRPAPPEAVAAVVLDALLGPAPAARYLVGTRWEGERVLQTLTERLVDAALSPSQQLTRDEIVAWIDRELAAR